MLSGSRTILVVLCLRPLAADKANNFACEQALSCPSLLQKSSLTVKSAHLDDLVEAPRADPSSASKAANENQAYAVGAHPVVDDTILEGGYQTGKRSNSYLEMLRDIIQPGTRSRSELMLASLHTLQSDAFLWVCMGSGALLMCTIVLFAGFVPKQEQDFTGRVPIRRSREVSDGPVRQNATRPVAKQYLAHEYSPPESKESANSLPAVSAHVLESPDRIPSTDRSASARSDARFSSDLPVGVLCPQLVVPDQSECTLLVPKLSRRNTSWKSGYVTVDDSRGQPVFRCHLGGSPGMASLTLSSATDAQVFASCVEQAFDVVRKDYPDIQPSNASRKIIVLHPAAMSGTPFGVLWRETNHIEGVVYKIKCHGEQFQLVGQYGRMQFTNSFHNLLATSETTEFERSTDSHLSVQIGPTVDAGLVALCLMSHHLLED